MTVEEFWKEFMELSNNVTVHCKTQDEANEFCRMMNEHRFDWSSTTKEYGYYWDDYEENTCYDNQGDYDDYYWYKDNNYKIYEYSEIFNDTNQQEKTFTLKDIKSGYLVKLRDEILCICVDENDKDIGFYSKNGGWETSLSEYTNDLCNNADYDDCNKYDIVEVYGLHKSGNLFNINNRELLWERKEEIVVTTQQLKDLYCKNGEKLVIKDNDDVVAEI